MWIRGRGFLAALLALTDKVAQAATERINVEAPSARRSCSALAGRLVAAWRRADAAAPRHCLFTSHDTARAQRAHDELWVKDGMMSGTATAKFHEDFAALFRTQRS